MKPGTTCPTCAEPLEAATSLKSPKARPKDGDLSICFYCGTLLVFVGNAGAVRAMTDVDQAQIDPATLDELAMVKTQILTGKFLPPRFRKVGGAGS